MDDKGLWLISEALDKLEKECEINKDARNEMKDELNHGSFDVANKEVDYQNLSRGDLMNDKMSLCCFFSSFACVILSPLECTSQFKKNGKLVSRKVKKPLPLKFLRMAAALVVYYRWVL